MKFIDLCIDLIYCILGNIRPLYLNPFRPCYQLANFRLGGLYFRNNIAIYTDASGEIQDGANHLHVKKDENNTKRKKTCIR